MNEKNLLIVLIILIIIVGIIFFIDGHFLSKASGGNIIFQPAHTADWDVDSNRTKLVLKDKGFYFTNLTNGTNTVSIFKNNSTHSFDGTSDLIFEFDYRAANPFTTYLVTGDGERVPVGQPGNVKNTWVHEKWVYDSANQKITEYVNGEEKSPVDLSGKNRTTLGFQVVDWQGDINLYIEDWKVCRG